MKREETEDLLNDLRIVESPTLFNEPNIANKPGAKSNVNT
jgi:hypothetical protein